MNKYNFDLEIEQVSALSLIANRIVPNSTVLEVGPAHGRFTEYLKNTLHCTVDIVEIDEESGMDAKQFSRNAWIGLEDGDIENPNLHKMLQNQSYDYIIFADVLEHLHRPEQVLKKCSSFLAENGTILVSIPNIAHNAILVNLYYNTFHYTDIGLLDETHIHFWGINDFAQMCTQLEFEIIGFETFQCAFRNTEQSVFFDAYYSQIETFLTPREHGDAYQLIFALQKASSSFNLEEKNRKEVESACKFTIESSLLFDFGNGFNGEDSVKSYASALSLPGQYRVHFDINNTSQSLRFDPVEGVPCLIKIHDILSDGTQKITSSPVNATGKHDSFDEFLTIDPIYKLAGDLQDISYVEIIFEIEFLSPSQVLQRTQEKAQRNDSQAAHIELLLASEQRLIQEKNQEVQEKNQEIQAKNQEIQEKLQEIKNKEGHIELLLEVEREYVNLQHTRAWRVMGMMWKTRATLLPLGSKRSLFAGLAFKFVRHPILFMKKLSPKKIKGFFKTLKQEGAAATSTKLDNNLLPPSNTVSVLSLEGMPQEENAPIESYEKLELPVFENPLVSIIIPAYNQFAHSYLCLKSIKENTQDVAYEVILADDCSTDATADVLSCVQGLRVEKPAQNLRFLLNCNHAATYAKGRYILFLNNDTQVQKGWLASLVELIEREESIGMVGSKLVYPNGCLQEAGGILWRDGSAWNYGNKQDADMPEFNYVKEVDYISGAAIMIKKDLWEEIGGFDERYTPAYCEDSDLAFEVRKRGYKVLYQPLSVVVHFEGVSNGTDTSEGLKAYQVENGKKFFEKWKPVLEAEHFPNGEEVFLARDRSRNKKTVLVVDHYVPHHDKDAGGKCTYMYIKLFISLGLKVVFIGDNFFPHQPYTQELEQMGVTVLYGQYYNNNWKSWIKAHAKYIDYAYLNRPHISVKYMDFLKEHTKAKIIYFGHDLHFLREYREYELSQDAAILKSSEDWKKKEFDLFGKADVIFVVGSFEQEVLKKEFPQKPIYNIPVYIYEKIREDVDKCWNERKDIMFVGGFAHPPNEDAVMWFAENVFPKVKQAYPDIKWYVIGSKPPKKVQELADENTIITGFVSDEELANFYASCRLAVVPLRVGAGVKGKVVEAVYNQIPLLTTPIGAEGLSLEENAFEVVEPTKEMADTIIELYADFEKLQAMSDNSVAFIQNHFTTKTANDIVLQEMLIEGDETR